MIVKKGETLHICFLLVEAILKGKQAAATFKKKKKHMQYNSTRPVTDFGVYNLCNCPLTVSSLLG